MPKHVKRQGRNAADGALADRIELLRPTAVAGQILATQATAALLGTSFRAFSRRRQATRVVLRGGKPAGSKHAAGGGDSG